MGVPSFPFSRLGPAAAVPVRWLTGWWRIVFFGACILVLAGSPSSYGRETRSALLRHLYQDTAPILWWFTALCALLTLVITRIVVVTAYSYGLSGYALEMVIRVLVLELIPLTAALSCVVALVLAYFAVYGWTLAGVPGYTHVFGHVFNPSVALIFLLKTVFFSLAVSIIPMASGLYDIESHGSRESAALQGLVRMFAVLLVLEAASLAGNYA
jgi:phospholipid/cholesterol/gamma-HCH transport system permease protein